MHRHLSPMRRLPMLPSKIANAALPAALLCLAASAYAQGTTGTAGGASSPGAAPSGSMNQPAAKTSKAGSSSSSQLDRADRKFVENAAKDGLAEVELGQLASQRAQSPEVKQF